MDEPGRDEPDRDETVDRDLAKLFQQAHAPLPADNFSFAVERSVQRARTRRRFWRVVLFVDVLVVALLVSPYVMDGSVALADSLSIGIAHLASALLSPIGMGCSLAFGAWFLRRIRRLAA
jgi:Asp-tRNA(Asn)/Glu-tRNA(Gln) amidotransferase A subunit family amidase